jgi:hypothetical protein
LSDYLGDDHDLAVLRNTILAAPAYSNKESETLPIVQIIDQEQLVLQENAMTLGKRLFPVAPKKFVQRMKTYWSAWENETSNESNG